MDILKVLVEEFKLKASQVKSTVELLDEGNTIPFIARYRKEQTGELEDVVLRDLSNRLTFLRNLEARKEEVIRLIDEQGNLTEEIKEDITAAQTIQRIDDLYRPFRPKRRTRAIIAKEKGLDPLAQIILQQSLGGQDFKEAIESYIDPEKQVNNQEEALAGAMDIIAEIIADDAEYRERARRLINDKGIISVSPVKKDEKSVYEMYYNYQEPIKSIVNHRILAINRGEKDKILRVAFDLVDIDVVEILVNNVVKEKDHDTSKYLQEAVEDGYKRLLFPSIEREIRNMLTERAEEEAIKVFAINLEPLLLQAPIKGKNVMAIDPGFRTGCKVAVVDETGKIQDHSVVYPTAPQNQVEKTKEELKRLIQKWNVHIIAIGNGTASRETETIVAEMLKELDREVSYIIVSEAGASIYSASDVARKEFPDLDVTIRGAVSIGRRLQDPLAELVKIEPRHIGVGQYQHDLNQKKLDESLTAVVEDCVNSVGVDLNTASPSLLSYVAGVSARVADNVILHREEIGMFKNRKELLKVKGLGPKTFVQCAGFLRIPGGDNPLDNTGVHPESYKVADQLLKMDYTKGQIEEISESLDVGIPTLEDIIKELEKPGRDPRDGMPKPILRQDILKVQDLKAGMILTGTVRNVVDFGAFVDIGVTEDGLVHISHLADKFIKHPKDVVKVGDIVQVKILDVDVEKGRISLSMKEVGK